MPVKTPLRFRMTLPAGIYCARLLPISLTTKILQGLIRRNQRVFLNPKRITKNIRMAFPNTDEHTAKELTSKIIANLGRHIAELIHVPAFRDGLRGTSIEIVDFDPVPFKDHGPSIYVGPHVGSWELAPLAMTRQGRPLTVVYSQNKNMDGLITKLIENLRSETGGQYFEKTNAIKPVVSALARGESVAILVEQRVDSGITVDFFGRPTVFTNMPAKLALKFDVPLIPFEVDHTGPVQLRMTFHEAISPNGPQGRRSEYDLTQNMASAAEDIISRNCDTWFCNKLRWKEPVAEQTDQRAAIS